jgi:hypothetical protein
MLSGHIGGLKLELQFKILAKEGRNRKVEILPLNLTHCPHLVGVWEGTALGSASEGFGLGSFRLTLLVYFTMHHHNDLVMPNTVPDDSDDIFSAPPT